MEAETLILTLVGAILRSRSLIPPPLDFKTRVKLRLVSRVSLLSFPMPSGQLGYL